MTPSSRQCCNVKGGGLIAVDSPCPMLSDEKGNLCVRGDILVINVCYCMCIFTKFTLFTVEHIRQHLCPTIFEGHFESTNLRAKYVDFKIYKLFFWRSLAILNVRAAKDEKKHVRTQYSKFVAVYAHD